MMMKRKRGFPNNNNKCTPKFYFPPFLPQVLHDSVRMITDVTKKFLLTTLEIDFPENLNFNFWVNF